MPPLPGRVGERNHLSAPALRPLSRAGALGPDLSVSPTADSWSQHTCSLNSESGHLCLRLWLLAEILGQQEGPHPPSHYLVPTPCPGPGLQCFPAHLQGDASPTPSAEGVGRGRRGEETRCEARPGPGAPGLCGSELIAAAGGGHVSRGDQSGTELDQVGVGPGKAQGRP